MFIDLSKAKLFVKPGATDMRKQQAGLAAVVQNIMKADPFTGSLYLFCNRRRNLLKVLYWEKNGFCLWQKRLEQDTFPWPRDEQQAREIDARQLRLLLEGLDIWRAHKQIKYTKVS
ncbi:MAG: IS66 family insertion sequence element accessory protein TnpB [Bacillota bacterium]|nr:IS66 family insertion sequence element accessory protein TnpB [Bacillota bacterium]